MTGLRSLVGAVLWRTGAAALCFSAGAWMGQTWSERAAATAQSAELRRISGLYLQAVHDGDARAAQLQGQLSEVQAFATELAQRSRDVPTLVRACRPPATPGATHPGRAVAVAPEPGPSERALGGPVDLAALPAPADAAGSLLPAGNADGAAGAGEPHLTAGAIGLWNSALAGALVPTGTCSLDDPASGACAADTEVTLRDAWDNQAINAAACRASREQLAALIDHLRARERTWPPGRTD